MLSILFPFVVSIITFLAVAVMLGFYCEYQERKAKEQFKRLAQNKVYIGTPEQLARLREWDEQRN